MATSEPSALLEGHPELVEAFGYCRAPLEAPRDRNWTRDKPTNRKPGADGNTVTLGTRVLAELKPPSR